MSRIGHKLPIGLGEHTGCAKLSRLELRATNGTPYTLHLLRVLLVNASTDHTKTDPGPWVVSQLTIADRRCLRVVDPMAAPSLEAFRKLLQWVTFPIPPGAPFVLELRYPWDVDRPDVLMAAAVAEVIGERRRRRARRGAT